MNIFKKYAAAVCVPPIKEDIFLDLEASIRRENLIRRFFQRLIKDFTLLIYGQFKLDKTTIPNKKMKILWIHYGRLNIGDLLMDFSPRFLFDNKKFSIDLFTKDSVNEIFINDQYFKNLITNPSDLAHKKYDFIIMQKFSGPIIKLKIKYLKNIKSLIKSSPRLIKENILPLISNIRKNYPYQQKYSDWVFQGQEYENNKEQILNSIKNKFKKYKKQKLSGQNATGVLGIKCGNHFQSILTDEDEHPDPEYALELIKEINENNVLKNHRYFSCILIVGDSFDKNYYLIRYQKENKIWSLIYQ